MFERDSVLSVRPVPTHGLGAFASVGLAEGFMGLHEPDPFDFCKSRCGSDDPATGTYSASNQP